MFSPSSQRPFFLGLLCSSGIPISQIEFDEIESRFSFLFTLQEEEDGSNKFAHKTCCAERNDPASSILENMIRFQQIEPAGQGC